MEKELRQLRSLFPEESDSPSAPTSNTSKRVIVSMCGIGKVNAALGAAELIRKYQPDVIVSSGCAGGVGDDLAIQDVVVSTEIAYHDVYCGKAIDDSTIYGQVQGLPARFPADATLLAKSRQLLEAAAAGEVDDTGSPLPRLVPGLIVTGDWFVDSREKMREIVGHFPDTRAVDMESAAIAQTCYIYHVPFISFRIVSDIPLSDTHAAQYHDFWNTMADRSFHVTRRFIESL